MNAEFYRDLFERCFQDYHRAESEEVPCGNPFPPDTLEALLYRKANIDIAQWHLEDRIRDPALSGEEVRELKRRIDQSNQARTDAVERMDDRFVETFSGVVPLPAARMNSESPGWILDRLCILVLKIIHMREQAERTDAAPAHREVCQNRLRLLEEQSRDLMRCFDELIEDLSAGRRTFKVYRQMKMYNDETLNPVLYRKRSGAPPDSVRCAFS